MGFIPPNATNIERGPGFVAFEKGGQAHILFPKHQILVRQVAQAMRYAANHGGDLPHSAFWNKTADVYDDNARLFRKEHQCSPLLKLLRRDESFDRENPVPILPPVTPLVPGIPTTPISPGMGSGGDVSSGGEDTPGGGVTPGAVPEPASVMMLGLGLLVTFVVGRRGIGPRSKPE